MSSGMNFEVYTKIEIGDFKADNVLAQFPHYTILNIALDVFYKAFGDNLYVRAITDEGQSVIGKLSHKAKYIISSPKYWPLQG